MRYIKEDFDPSINVEGGSIDINDDAVEDAINRYISAVTAKACVTPYIALEKIRKILAYYKIFIPQTVFLEGDEGNEVFEISQFGDKMGMTDDGEVKVKNDDGLYLYFEWMMNEDGLFDVFSEIVDEDELDELLADFDEEGEDEDNDDSDGAEPSHDMYKAANMREETEQLDEGMLDWAKSKLGMGSKPDIRRMPEKDMDSDVRQGISDYNKSQQDKETSNAVKTSWMMSSNPTYKNRGRMMPYQDVDSDERKETMRGKLIDKQNARDIRRLNELRDETKAGYALKAADQITDYVANRTAYDTSSEGEKKTKQLQKRIRGLQMLDRSEKKKKKIKAILKSRMKKR